MSVDPRSILQQARVWSSEGQRVACATVVGTWSSSPRPVGSQMIITPGARFAGSVSGGCVEGAIVSAADELFAGGAARTLRYGVSTEQAWEVGLPCGGTIEVLLRELSPSLLERLGEAVDRRESVALVSDLSSGREGLWEPSWPGSPIASRPVVSQELASAVAAAVHREQSQLIELAGQRWFVHVLSAPLRLVVVGAVHLTQALAAIAALSGIDVTVVDPRTAFATAERFPGVTLSHAWPDEALLSFGLDRRTAVVVLSHDSKLDEPALAVALRSDCFYIGALGSRRTQAARRARLAEAGFDEAALGRINGPVGLDIGASTTPEIAIAIMAQIVQVLRSRANDLPALST
jgi:xanthine dehydrogenase accessory factor